MNRRVFLSLIATGLAAAADPECLLWQPDRKLISIPAEPKEEVWIWHSDPFYVPMLNGDRAGPCRIDYSTGELRFVNVSWLRKERVLTPEYIKLMYG